MASNESRPTDEELFVLVIYHPAGREIYAFWERGPANTQLYLFVKAHWNDVFKSEMPDMLEDDAIDAFFDAAHDEYDYSFRRKKILSLPEVYNDKEDEDTDRGSGI